MKFAIALLVLGLAPFAQASTLPKNVRAEMQAQIKRDCRGVGGITELETQVTDQEYDQGKRDVYYVTDFSARLSFDAFTKLTVTAITDEAGNRVAIIGKIKSSIVGICR